MTAAFRFAVCISLVLSAPCWAQETAQEAFDRLAKRLDEIQQTLGSPDAAGLPGQTLTVPRGSMDKAVRTMQSVVEEFRASPWIRIKGFKVSIGMPPRLDIDFEFPATPDRAGGK